MGKSSPTDGKQATSAQGAASSDNVTPPAVDNTKQAGDPREAVPSDTLVDESEAKEVKEIPLSGAASKSSGADMGEADSKASADAAASDVNLESKAPEMSQVDPPEFKTPRHATLEDVRGLIFAGMLRQEEVDLPDFLVPECPPHWKLPDPPNLKTNAYLVGVPGIVNDIRAGAFAMEGYGGATTLIGFEELSDDDLQELKEICGVRGGVDVLNPRRSPLSSYDLDNALNSIGVRREMVSLLRHFNSTRFAERVFKTTGYLRQVLGAYRSMRSLAVAQQGPTAIQQAVDTRRKNKELKRSWKFTCDYRFLELQEALGKLESAKSEHKVALQEQKLRYQDEIDFQESERAELKARLADSEAQVLILKSRLESATVDPWKFSDFLQEHTDFTGNWERLHDLFKLCVKDTKPPESWDTVVNVAAMDKRKAAVAPYPEKSQRTPPSSGSDSANRPEILDLTGTSSNSQGGSGGNNETQAPKVRKVQRRPKDHQPGRDSVRRAGEKTVVSKEAAHSMLPGGVVWKEVRPDVRQAILAGLKYDTAMEWIGNDRAAHGHFRQPQLIKMLVSMMYWRRLDKTPWSKYVPEAYYEMADERLDRRLRRGDVPAPWGNLDDHVVYPDEDADSTVDDVKNDPEYQPPTQEPEESSSGSSCEEEDEEVAPEVLDEADDAENDDGVEAKETLDSKPPAKRPRSVSSEKSQDPNLKPKKQRRKATKKNASALQGSNGKSRHSQDPRLFVTLLDRSHDTPGFLPSLWNEPGLWQFPDKCCYWIWKDPRAEELGGPTCEILDLQLATLDMREPARVQWSTVIDDEEWLQYVPSNVKRHVKPVAIGKLNPLSLTHS
ncbi:Hypothetical protein PHPALM_37595 [Phytophthora palmivora]|uniref:Uncharacterized protein n=1 Tax=Phytophthora palmivora TaxID=4796 RepID=A0A2P4WX19_9STRA|nr:Hypothetical protein PHPALM_37595 [Phytophthora palmivora]